MSRAEAPVLYEFDAGVARVTINRPDARNALSQEVMEGLQDAEDAIEGVTAFLQKRDPAWKGR